MSKAFIRALWGDVSSHRSGKIAKEILSVTDRDWFTTYVFGEENEKWLKSQGFKTILVTPENTLWDLETELYRHKLEVFKVATNDFEEFAFLDWDCIPTGDISYAWDELRKKETFQANLFQYRTKKCLWREEEQRKVCNGGFAYFRDPSIPQKMIDFWDEFRIWVSAKQKERKEKGKDIRFREKSLVFDDEPAMSKYIDWVSGGWCGKEKYWDLFEPEVCNLRKKSVYPQKMLDSKKSCFIHNL